MIEILINYPIKWIIQTPTRVEISGYPTEETLNRLKSLDISKPVEFSIRTLDVTSPLGKVVYLIEHMNIQYNHLPRIDLSVLCQIVYDDPRIPQLQKFQEMIDRYK